MDLSKLSDADLMALDAKDYSKLSDEGLKYLSAPEGAPPQQEEPGLLSKMGSAALSGIGKAASFVDSYTGAPVRAGIGAVQAGGSLPEAAAAYKNQFGQDSSLAPTGKDIAHKAGVPDTSLSDVIPGLYNETGEGWRLQKGGMGDISASGVAGLGVDIATDPITYVPVGAIAKGAGKVVEAAKPSMIKGVAKVGETLTGAPAREFETYMSYMPEINKNIAKFGGDTSIASDQVRKSFMSDIQKARRGANLEIENAIKLTPVEKQVVSINPVIEALETEKLKVNSKLKPEVIAQIDEIIGKVKSVAPEGHVDLQNAMDIKSWLQDIGSGEYLKDGKIFTPGKEVSRAAKNAAFQARATLNEVSPEIAAANKKLALMHTIEKRMNRNLIAEGKPEAALLSAGGENLRNRGYLESLGNITGTDMVGEADKLAAMRRLANPPILPVDTTGKTAARMGAAYMVGGTPLVAATSPMAWKYGMNAGRVAGDVASYIGKGIQSPLSKPAYQAGMSLGREANKQPKIDANQLISKMSNNPGTQKYVGAIQQAAERGPDAVAATHFLLQQSSPEYSQMMQDSEDGTR